MRFFRKFTGSRYSLLRFFAILSILGLANCSYKPICIVNHVELTPLDSSGYWENGTQAIPIPSVKIAGKLQYLNFKEDLLEFQLALKQNAKDTTVIDPTAFSLIPKYPISDTSHRNDSMPIASIDPESFLISIIGSLHQLEAAKNPTESLGYQITMGVLGGILEGALGVSPPTDEELETKAQERIEESKAWEMKRKSDIEKTKERLNYFKSNLMRKTTLFPNQELKGKIYFPLIRNAEGISVYLDSVTSKKPIEYRQSVLCSYN